MCYMYVYTWFKQCCNTDLWIILDRIIFNSCMAKFWPIQFLQTNTMTGCKRRPQDKRDACHSNRLLKFTLQEISQ